MLSSDLLQRRGDKVVTRPDTRYRTSLARKTRQVKAWLSVREERKTAVIYTKFTEH